LRALALGEGVVRFDPVRPDPIIPEGEALIRPLMAGICNTDLELAKGYMKFNGVLGHEFVGVVETSPNKELLGQRVVAEINCFCGKCDYCLNDLTKHCPERSVIGILDRDGAFADYVAAPVINLHPVPDSLSDQEAVFVEPLAAAFEILEQVNIGPDQDVAVLGDGKLGLLVAQVVATTNCHLLAVGKHNKRLSILAARNIKTALADEMGGEKARFDIEVEATGSPSGLSMAMDMVKPCGTIVLKSTVAKPLDIDINRLVIDEITVVGSRCGPFDKAIQALEDKLVDVIPLITETLPLDKGETALKLAADKSHIKILLEI